MNSESVLPREAVDLLLKRASERLDRHDDDPEHWCNVARDVANELANYADTQEAEGYYQKLSVVIHDGLDVFHAMRRELGLDEHPESADEEMSMLDDEEVAFLRRLKPISGQRFLVIPSTEPQPYSLATSGHATRIEAVDICGEPTNYWSITQKGMNELKRIDARNGE